MNISFLLGAGFSVPDNYPTRWGINKRLRQISHEEIMIHSDGTALFLNGRRDPNGHWQNVNEKIFVERFINYYTENIIPSIDNFDYEAFFDFYQGFIKGKFKCYKFEAFTDKFRQDTNCETDNANLLSGFHNTFNQLLASLLMKWPPAVHLSKPYTKYPEFLNYIESISESFENLYFHTLNHDLLLEELSHSDAFNGRICDGFEEIGSPFYSKDNDGKTVRLRKFTNKYDSKFKLFKLHGSIDHYIYNFQNKEYDSIKVPYGVSTIDLMKEYKTEDGETKMDKCFWNYYPDFLSGTKTKIESYEEQHYYKPIFSHLRNNLKNSNYLICIGYGLADSKVNEFIKENFLSDKSKIMIVITPSKPKSDLFDYENVKYYGVKKGIEHIDKDEIEKLMNK